MMITKKVIDGSDHEPSAENLLHPCQPCNISLIISQQDDRLVLNYTVAN